MDRTIISLVRTAFASVLLASFVSVTALGAAPATASALTAGLAPTIFGSLADMNGSGTVTTGDDSNAFYGDTAIIDGGLDCNAWLAVNDGAAGDGTIDTLDDCTLIGYDGTANGVTILVVAGLFDTADGQPILDGRVLPAVFNAANPDNPNVPPSDFAWSTINGLVDSNGSGTITGDDCSFGVVGTVDVLGSDVGCGFGSPVAPADNGKVDLNDDIAITSADTCTNHCFLGRNVVNGVVSDCTILGTGASETLIGTAGRDIVCGLGGLDTLTGGDRNDTLEGGKGNDILLGGAGNDLLSGGPGSDSANGGKGRDRCVSVALQKSCEL